MKKVNMHIRLSIFGQLQLWIEDEGFDENDPYDTTKYKFFRKANRTEKIKAMQTINLFLQRRTNDKKQATNDKKEKGRKTRHNRKAK